MCVNVLLQPGPLLFVPYLTAFRGAQKDIQYSVNTALISDKENICKWKPSLRSRRLEVVGERENGRARGRHACTLACPFRVPVYSCSHYFQAPATQASESHPEYTVGWNKPAGSTWSNVK